MLGTSSEKESVKRPKRDVSHKEDQLSKVTIEELTIELAKTQVSSSSW